MDFKKEVKNIEAAGYNGMPMVFNTIVTIDN